MEVVGAHVCGCDVDGTDAVRFDVDDAALDLEDSFDIEEAGTRDDDAIALEEIGSDDDVGDAGFVFHGQEDEAFGSARALTRDNTSGDAYIRVALVGEELASGYITLTLEKSALIAHGMRPAGEAGAGVVGCEALVGCHLL